MSLFTRALDFKITNYQAYAKAKVRDAGLYLNLTCELGPSAVVY